MLTSLNWNFSKISLLIGGSHTQNSQCFPFTNPLETFGNILSNLSQYYTDYQYYTKQKIVQAWKLLVACPTHRGSRIALSCCTDNARVHADMIIRFYKEIW